MGLQEVLNALWMSQDILLYIDGCNDPYSRMVISVLCGVPVIFAVDNLHIREEKKMP